MRLRIAVFAAGLLAFGILPFAQGEDAVLNEIYGRGVHAFFGGRYEEAAESFTDAITQGSKDPRVFYYRGLTMFHLGRLDEANGDFATGATEEVKDVALSGLASRSLARIQGGPRMLIEKARQTARKEHRAEVVTREKLRYEEFQSNEKRMLRNVPKEEVKPEQPAKPEEAATPEQPKTDVPPAEPKPEAKPAEPAKEDPFGSTPAKPETPPPAAPPAKAADPFGG